MSSIEHIIPPHTAFISNNIGVPLFSEYFLYMGVLLYILKYFRMTQNNLSVRMVWFPKVLTNYSVSTRAKSSVHKTEKFLTCLGQKEMEAEQKSHAHTWKTWAKDQDNTVGAIPWPQATKSLHPQWKGEGTPHSHHSLFQLLSHLPSSTELSCRIYSSAEEGEKN